MKKMYLVKKISAVALSALLVSGTVEMMAGSIVASAEGNVTVGVELLSDASFEAGLYADGTAWIKTPESWDNVTIDNYSAATHEGSNAVNYWTQSAQTITISQTVELEAGTYSFTAYDQGEDTSSYLFIGSQVGTSVTMTGWGTWDELSETFTITEDGSYTVGIALVNNAGGWGYLDDMSLKCTALASANAGGEGGQAGGEGGQGATMNDIALTNGDFENGSTGWTLTGFSAIAVDSNASVNKTNLLDLWLSNSDDTAGAAEYSVKLSAGKYVFSYSVSGAGAASGLTASVKVGATVLTSGTEITTTGWDVWQNLSTDEFTLTQDAVVTFSLAGTVPAGYWGKLDNLTLKGTGSIVTDSENGGQGGEGGNNGGEGGNNGGEGGNNGGQQTTYYPASDPVVGELEVERVTQLSTDFIMGVDISSVVSELASGVVYYDYDGNAITNINSFCAFLKSQGITHVRVRVWNDPKNASGNGYGGGNNDVATAKVIADACASNGLKMLVDFHCSDFWTDPGKQYAPKAWSGKTSTEKATLLKDFVKTSLETIDASKNVVAMVQIGNETNNGIAGESSVSAMCELFNAGSEAVREYNSSVKVVIHVTNPEKSTMTKWAKNLSDYSVDYDILGTSYYPYWHGTLANLKSQMSSVKSTYGKDVMVVETSYAYTLNDSDGHSNTVRVGNNDDRTSSTNYCTEEFSVQGQATSIRNLIQAVADVEGLGVFYWEPAWITVGDTTGLSGDSLTAKVNANKVKWETYGSGWASSYSAQYDPTDAGVWYGGSAVDNEAMFYSDGTPTAGWKVWNYVKTGAKTNFIEVNAITEPTVEMFEGDTLNLPTTVTVTYNKGTADDSVVWNTADIQAIDVNVAGTYTINGTVTFSKTVNKGTYASATTANVACEITIKKANLLAADVASFETGNDYISSDASVLKITNDDPHSGSKALHWWKSTATEESFTYSGTITLSAGTYTLTAYAQGKAGDKVSINILDENGNVLVAGEQVTLNDWKNWKTPEATITVSSETKISFSVVVDMQAGGWGTVDDLYLYKATVADAGNSNSGSGNSNSNNSSNASNNGTGTVNASGSTSSNASSANSSANAGNTVVNSNISNTKKDQATDTKKDAADTTVTDALTGAASDDANTTKVSDAEETLTADKVEMDESAEAPLGGVNVTSATETINSSSSSNTNKAVNISLIIGIVVAVGLVVGLSVLVVRASRFGS